jgi:GT2 family glycosyltransferase
MVLLCSIRKNEVYEMLDVSIIIVNWNQAEVTKQCIDSIINQTHKHSYNIFLVDNGSTDGSVEIIQKNFSTVNIIRNSENRGFSAANNQAMDLTESKYLLLLNNDTIVINNAIDLLIDKADSLPNAGIIGPRLIHNNKQIQNSIGLFPSFYNSIKKALISKNSFATKVFPKLAYHQSPIVANEITKATEVDFVIGACMLVRREAYKIVGKLDEDYFFYAEDVDWCFRFHKANWSVVYDPSIQIIHFGGLSASSKWGDSNQAALVFAERLFYKKSYGTIAEAIFRLKILFIYSIRFLLELINNAPKNAKINKVFYKNIFTSVFVNNQRSFSNNRN